MSKIIWACFNLHETFSDRRNRSSSGISSGSIRFCCSYKLFQFSQPFSYHDILFSTKVEDGHGSLLFILDGSISRCLSLFVRLQRLSPAVLFKPFLIVWLTLRSVFLSNLSSKGFLFASLLSETGFFIVILSEFVYLIWSKSFSWSLNSQDKSCLFLSF